MPLDEISVGKKSDVGSSRDPGPPSEIGDGDPGIFTDQEIRAQLEALGYENIPDYQLRLFRDDLEMLICYEQAKHNAPEEFAKSPPPTTPPHDRAESVQADADKLGKPKTKKPKKKSKGRKSPNYCGRELPFERRRRSPSPALSDTSRVSAPSPVRWHRRKVLRHINGVPVVCEEPFTDAETDVSALSDRLSSLPMEDTESEPGTERPSTWGADCPIINTIMCKDARSLRRPSTSQPVPKKGKLTRGQFYDEIVRYLPKSFMESHGPYQPMKKTAPADRYKMYRQCWNNCRIPGESPDQELTWCIRALLMTKRCPEVQAYALKRKDAIEHARRIKDSNFLV